ncbi:MAG: KEOPS complex subunit Cgi121 [Candidatus Syntropharchaeia archaeon]
MHIVEGEVEIPDLDGFIDRLRKISEREGVVIQALDADKLAGEDHVRAAVSKAKRSMEEGKNISGDLGMEILLYAAGRRQINKALEIGVSEGKNNVAIVILGSSPSAISEVEKMVRKKSVLPYNDSKKKKIMEFFGITEEEIGAVGEEKIPKLVLERVALLDVLK